MGGGDIFSQYLIIISALSYILWGWLFPLEWVWFAEYGTVCSRCACIYRHMNILAAELWLFSESKCYWSPGVYRKCILLLYCTHYNNISSTVIPGNVCPRKDWEQKVNIEGVFFLVQEGQFVRVGGVYTGYIHPRLCAWPRACPQCNTSQDEGAGLFVCVTIEKEYTELDKYPLQNHWVDKVKWI